MLHAFRGTTVLGIHLTPQCYILPSTGLPWRGTRCPQPWLESVGAKETSREAGGAARGICLNSKGQSLAQGY